MTWSTVPGRSGRVVLSKGAERWTGGPRWSRCPDRCWKAPGRSVSRRSGMPAATPSARPSAQWLWVCSGAQ